MLYALLAGRFVACGLRMSVLNLGHSTRGLIHEFMRWPFDDADQALNDAAAALRSAFGE